MRVLVVDDDKLVAVSLKTILEADGEIIRSWVLERREMTPSGFIGSSILIFC